MTWQIFKATPAGSGIKSIQRGTIVLTGVATNTAAVNAVDTTKAMLHLLGSDCNVNTTIDSFVRIALTNSTTITAIRNGVAGVLTVSYELIEYN